MVQLAGGVTAVQLRLVLVLVVPDAPSPVGALGVVVQLPPLPPVPLRAEVCGLFVALSVTVSVPVAGPETVGYEIYVDGARSVGGDRGSAIAGYDKLGADRDIADAHCSATAVCQV